MTNEPIRKKFFASQKNKIERAWLLTAVLVSLVAISSCVVGYLLGQRSEGESMGTVIDTFVLSPTTVAHKTLPMSLVGEVRETGGRAYANKKIVLRSEPREVVTDSEGRFLFYNVEKGTHHLQVIGDDGKVETELAIVVKNGAKSGGVLSETGGGYELSVAKDVLMVECEIELDKTVGEMSLNTKRLTSVSKNGVVTSSAGSASAAENGVIVTPLGVSVHPDGSLSIPSDGIILNDGTYITVDGTAYLHNGECKISPVGEVTMANGTVIAPGGVITLPSGETVTARKENSPPSGVTFTSTGTVILSDNTRVAADGIITLSCGTTITSEGKVTFPSGEIIAPDNSDVTLQDATKISLKTGAAHMPDGSVIQGGTITLPDGTIIDYDECSITMPDGTVMNDDKLYLPNGTVLDTLHPGTYADGTVISDKLTISLTNGFTVSFGGVLTTPSGTVIIPPDAEGGYIVGTKNSKPLDAAKLTPTVTPKPTQTPELTPAATPSRTDAPAASPEPGNRTETQPTPAPSSVPAGIPAPKITPAAPVDTPAPMQTPAATPRAHGGEENPQSTPGLPAVVTEGQEPWTQLSTINLFAASDSTVPGKVYPGVTGYYKFNISNPNSYGVDFTMTIAERIHSAGNIPFMYRLKCAGEYIAGGEHTWLTPAELMAVAVRLDAGAQTGCRLEWHWPAAGNDELDTTLGTSGDKEHFITITIFVEQVTR